MPTGCDRPGSAGRGRGARGARPHGAERPDAILEPTLPDWLASSLGVRMREIVRPPDPAGLRRFVSNVGGPYESTPKARAPSGTRAACGMSGIIIILLPDDGMSS
jgi:hypothetical protein